MSSDDGKIQVRSWNEWNYVWWWVIMDYQLVVKKKENSNAVMVAVITMVNMNLTEKVLKW